MTTEELSGVDIGSPKTDEKRITKSNSHSLGVNTKVPSVPPGALPWDEETITFSRDKGKTLTLLQRENLSLRTQLKDLNRKLDSVIGEIQARKEAKPYRPMKNTAKEELKVAQAQIGHYEKERAKLQVRVNQLSDPVYKLNLAEAVDLQELKLKSLETTLYHKQHIKTKREKVLGTVLETGETPEMANDVAQAITAQNVLTVKVRALEKTDKHVAAAFEKLAGKEEELSQEIRKLIAEVGDVPQDTGLTELQTRLSHVKEEESTKQKQRTSMASKLKLKYRQLKTELSDLKGSEGFLKTQIAEKTELVEKCAEEIATLTEVFKQKAVSIIPGKRNKSTSRLSSDVSKTSVFLTSENL